MNTEKTKREKLADLSSSWASLTKIERPLQSTHQSSHGVIDHHQEITPD